VVLGASRRSRPKHIMLSMMSAENRRQIKTMHVSHGTVLYFDQVLKKYWRLLLTKAL
jgi:hypothetical protein